MYSSLIPAVFMMDVVPDDIPRMVALQRALMERFFHNINPDTMQELSEGIHVAGICEWASLIRVPHIFTSLPRPRDKVVWMECTDGILESFTITKHGAPYDIAYLPNTIREVEINWSNLRCAVHTRQLPLRSILVKLNDNRINGSIDLTTLPPDLKEFDISMNYITGKIELINLPRGLSKLCLYSNRIRQRTVYYADLPPGFAVALGGGNMIEEIRPVWPEEKAPKDTFTL